MSNKTLFIVSKNESFEGAFLSLPTQNEDGSWTPGNWHYYKDFTSLHCRLIGRVGFRVTHEPVSKWHSENAACYEVECKELLSDCYRGFLYAQIRLLRQLSDEELVKYHILKYGSHTVVNSEVIVTGASKVILKGDSSAVVWSAGHVQAHDNSKVSIEEASSPILVEAYGQSTIDLSRASVITANNNSTALIGTEGNFTVLTEQSRLPKNARKLSSRIKAYDRAKINVRRNMFIRLRDKARVKVNISYPDD